MRIETPMPGKVVAVLAGAGDRGKKGQSLVVESTGFRDDGWLDVNGSPLTNAGHITERFTRDTFGHMTVDVTIEDPKSYTRAFTVRVEHGIMLDTNLIEFICNENEMSSQFFDP